MKDKVWFDGQARTFCSIRGIFTAAGNDVLLSNLLEQVYKQGWADCMEERVRQRIEMENNQKKGGK